MVSVDVRHYSFNLEVFFFCLHLVLIISFTLLLIQLILAPRATALKPCVDSGNAWPFGH